MLKNLLFGVFELSEGWSLVALENLQPFLLIFSRADSMSACHFLMRHSRIRIHGSADLSFGRSSIHRMLKEYGTESRKLGPSAFNG